MDDAAQRAGVEPPRKAHPARVDEKGRLKLPVDFQRYLAAIGDNRVFITTVEGRIARIYPISVWRENEILLRTAGPNAKAAEAVWLLASRYGDDAELDGQGRLLVPSELRKRLGLESEGVWLQYFFTGHIRIYTDAQFEQMTAEAFEGIDDKLAVMQEAGLR